MSRKCLEKDVLIDVNLPPSKNHVPHKSMECPKLTLNYRKMFSNDSVCTFSSGASPKNDGELLRTVFANFKLSFRLWRQSAGMMVKHDRRQWRRYNKWPTTRDTLFCEILNLLFLCFCVQTIGTTNFTTLRLPMRFFYSLELKCTRPHQR